MHIGLLLALGPLGHGHRPGVLIWNLFFLVQNGWLFLEKPRSQTEVMPVELNRTIGFQNLFARFVIVAVLVWPVFESYGYCDHWPAWAIYAAKPERVTAFVHSSELLKIPGHFNKYLVTEPVLDDWHMFRIDRWSLDTVYAPIYPQDRFQIGVAIGLGRKFDLNFIRVVIDGPANRWTGRRDRTELIGLQSILKQAHLYRCGCEPSPLHAFD